MPCHYFASGRAIDMIDDPLILASKIIERIKTDRSCTYSKLENRAKEKKIDFGVFSNAVNHLHKSNKILIKEVDGEFVYSIKPEVVKKSSMDAIYEWQKNNPYPYPEPCICQGTLCSSCFPFYDPAHDTIDQIRERLMMTREEYKALSRGQLFVKKNKYEYS